MLQDPQAELSDLKSQLPGDFQRDIDNLVLLLSGEDAGSVLGKIADIAEKALLILSGKHRIRWGDSEPALKNMIDPLRDAGAIPKNVAIHLETVWRNATAGMAFQEAPLDNSHVVVALIALEQFLRWVAFELVPRGPREPESPPTAVLAQRTDYRTLVRQSLNAAAPAQALEILNQAERLWPKDLEFRKIRLQCLLQVGATHEACQLAESLQREAAGDFDAALFLVTAQIELLQRGFADADGVRSRTLELIRRLLADSVSPRQLLSVCRCGVDLAVQLLITGGESESMGLLDVLPAACGRQALSASEELRNDLLRIETGVLRHDPAVEIVAQRLRPALEALNWRERFAVLRSTRKNLLFLADLRRAATGLLELLKTPGVVAFSGHMMDRPNPNDRSKSGRIQPRFTLEHLQPATEAIARKLEELDARVAFASVACGGDILFLEQVVQRGGEIHLVIPYPVDLFKADCVAGGAEGFLTPPGEDWASRFDALWRQAESRTILSLQRPKNNSMSGECCNATVLGTGLTQASERSTELTLVAMWDGHPGDAIGGTQSMISMASNRGVRIEFLSTLSRDKPTKAEFLNRLSTPPGALLSRDPPQEIRALLFADVVHFSRIEESRLMVFLERYLTPLTVLLEAARRREELLLSDTRGDGLYCVFRTVSCAGTFALELQEMVRKEQWSAWGMPADFNIRIGLHAGPVFTVEGDPEGRRSFWGSNINFAARIEPAAPPGQIFCTQVFAALAAVEEARFACEYVGEVSLPKGAGIHPMYALRRRWKER